MTMFPQIVIGTYEEFVLGYNPKYEDELGQKCKMIQTFATHSHQASVRCVAAHNKLMASSGADEYINIYDMMAMEVSTVINYHDSTVTCLEFTPDGTHLVTANQNGDIAIFRCKDWSLVKLWKEAHKHANGVTSINIHPSGSLLMTTGADNVVRFWNLVKGRQAYATNFSKKCSVGNAVNFGMWSRTGNYYAICIGNKLEIYTTEQAALFYEINTKTKITCASFTKKNLICLGTEDGSLEVHCLSEKQLIIKDQFHKTRVKSLTSFELKVYKNNKNLLQSYLVSVDSKGGIKLWYLRRKKLNYFMELKGEVECDCRITCLTVVIPKDVKGEKEDLPESTNSVEVAPDITVEDHKESGPDKVRNSIMEKDRLKKLKCKKVEQVKLNSSSTPQTNGTPKRKNSISDSGSVTVKKKKKVVAESDFGGRQKKNSTKQSGRVKQFKKKKLKFNSSEKIQDKRIKDNRVS